MTHGAVVRSPAGPSCIRHIRERRGWCSHDRPPFIPDDPRYLGADPLKPFDDYFKVSRVEAPFPAMLLLVEKKAPEGRCPFSALKVHWSIVGSDTSGQRTGMIQEPLRLAVTSQSGNDLQALP